LAASANTGEQYLRSVIGQFDTLHADSDKQPRVMGIPLHPMISAGGGCSETRGADRHIGE
jgi:hypothetical protein